MKSKLFILSLICVLLLSTFASCDSESFEEALEDELQTEEESETKAESETKKKEKKAKKSAYDKLTAEEKNAYKAAQNYLEYMAFSKRGLIDQLSSEYGDNYPAEVAEKAVKVLEKEEKIDWTEQAKKSAQNYLDTMSFSKQGLIDQLESEYGDKYTHEQAVAAVEAVYK